ncbi:MAG: AAA family ATPase, partial [Pseudomonadota bacterium]
FGKNFEGIEVPPLGPDEIREILVADARRRNIAIEASSTNRLISVCQQFLSSTNGPGPALQLQRDVFDYAEQKRGVNEPEPITPEFVEKVFSIYSGMPPFVVSPSISKPAAEISAWFHERIFGQSEAIRAIVESIALYKAGLHDPKKPIGSFLFVGPTGVGKTETARALAQFLFGSEDRMLRFDMSEFKDYHAFETLIGDPEKPLQPARLVDPVRSNPFQLVLLDEIEKAHRNVWDLLLQVLDEGRLTSGLGDSVSYCNTIIIATSNVGAAVQQRQRMGFVHDAGDSVRDRLRTELETEFRPELLNRFQHIVAFRALRKDEVMQIARAEIARVLRRQGLVDREINVDVADAVVSLVVNDGYDEKYGARSLKRMVQRHIALPIATLLLERRVNDTSIIRLDEKGGQVRGRLIQAPAASPVSKAPAKTAESLHRRDKTTDSLRQWLEQLKGQREELVDAMQAADRRTRAGGADAVSELPSDWKSSEELARYYRRVELELERSRRIDRLAAIEAELRSWIDRAGTPAERKAVASELAQYADEIRSATLELTQMEPMDASDAIVALLPLRADNSSAIEMFGVYQRWARHRGCELKMLCEPLTPDEPIVFGI